jgi:radical SAM protein with 4Fe4S-binding SPASM domain
MRNYMKDEDGCITPELFKKIFHEFIPYSIKLNWRGEPLINKGLPYMVKYAKDKGVHEVSFNTNGLLLNRENIYQLANAGLDWIIISVDGATKSTYEQIRRGGDFEKLVKNITLLNVVLVDFIKRPKIRLQICKQPLNEHEIETWRKMFKHFSNKLRVGHLFNPQGKSSITAIQPNSCMQPWQRMTIAWNGEMYPCPSDFLGKCKLGNLRNNTIWSAWHHPMMNYIRKQLKHGRVSFLCKDCSSYC